MTQDELEILVIEKCLHGNEAFFAQLRRQIPHRKLLKRKVDEAGFISEYQIPDNMQVGHLSGVIDDVGSTCNNKTILFRLYISDGKIDAMEGYSIPFGWPQSYENFGELTYAFSNETRHYSPLSDAFIK